MEACCFPFPFLFLNPVPARARARGSYPLLGVVALASALGIYSSVRHLWTNPGEGSLRAWHMGRERCAKACQATSCCTALCTTTCCLSSWLPVPLHCVPAPEQPAEVFPSRSYRQEGVPESDEVVQRAKGYEKARFGGRSAEVATAVP